MSLSWGRAQPGENLETAFQAEEKHTQRPWGRNGLNVFKGQESRCGQVEEQRESGAGMWAGGEAMKRSWILT